MHSEETKRKIADGVRRAHKECPRSAETRAKLSAAVALAHKEGRSGLHLPGNTLGRLRSEESKKRSLAACMAKVIGSHGFGLMHKGRPDHIFAKHWRIQAPDQTVYEFDNLMEWCRQNEALFPGDELEKTYKRPRWYRAAMGISGKSQWRGWSNRLLSTQEE